MGSNASITAELKINVEGNRLEICTTSLQYVYGDASPEQIFAYAGSLFIALFGYRGATKDVQEYVELIRSMLTSLPFHTA